MHEGHLCGASDTLPPQALPNASSIVDPSPSLPQPGNLLLSLVRGPEALLSSPCLLFPGLSAYTQTCFLLPRPKPKALLVSAQATGNHRGSWGTGSPNNHWGAQVGHPFLSWL